MSQLDAPPGTDGASEDDTPPVVVTRSGRRALSWLDDGRILPVATPPQGYPDDLLARRPHRSPVRATIVIPFLAIVALIAAYVGATQLWPLHAVPPEASTVEIAPPTAADTAVAWPPAGAAAVGVDGISTDAASTDAASSIASITKVVSALMVLEQAPLAVGETGPAYTFTNADRRLYQGFLARGESALPFPVGGELTQYQLLQGALIGSAGNYIDYLTSQYWTNDAVFASAARTWLARHNLGGITVVEPTGIDPANAATPDAVIGLGELALADPVIAEIVRTPQVELPGAGLVANTNDLLVDPTVVGLKTGTLDGQFNLLAAKDVAVGETSVRVFAATLGQPDDPSRDGETKRLLDAVAAEVAAPPVMPAGTRIGVVTTPWGASADIVTQADAWVVLWNRAAAATASTLDVGEARAAGEEVGSLTLTGPLGTATVGAQLSADLPDPDGWWRLTHPLELFGIVD